jgi:hypothetical protein
VVGDVHGRESACLAGTGDLGDGVGGDELGYRLNPLGW